MRVAPLRMPITARPSRGPGCPRGSCSSPRSPAAASTGLSVSKRCEHAHLNEAARARARCRGVLARRPARGKLAGLGEGFLGSNAAFQSSSNMSARGGGDPTQPQQPWGGGGQDTQASARVQCVSKGSAVRQQGVCAAAHSHRTALPYLGYGICHTLPLDRGAIFQCGA